MPSALPRLWPILLATLLALDPASSAFADGLPAAQQDWMLNCQGCHRADGMGSPRGVPPLPSSLSHLLCVEGGREFLARVPGVANAPLSDAASAEVLNWMVARYAPAPLAREFRLFTASEVSGLRQARLGPDLNAVRARLFKQSCSKSGGREV
jgi:hypothetical protein